MTQPNEEPVFIDPTLLQRAEEACKRQLGKDPENRQALRALAELYRKMGSLAEASGLYDRVFSLDPQDREADYLRTLLGGGASPTPPPGMHASPFVLLNDFLPQDFHDALLPFVTARQDSFAPSRVGTNAEYKPEVRQSLELPTRWQDGERFQRLLAKVVPDVIRRLHLAPFPIGRYTIRVRAYTDGHFFRIHMDTDRSGPGAYRVFNFVYFFHRVPRQYAGGDLLLFDTDIEADTYTRARFTRVVPEDNSIIFFPSRFYHSVIPIRCESQDFADNRFVINGHISSRMDADAEGAVESQMAEES